MERERFDFYPVTGEPVEDVFQLGDAAFRGDAYRTFLRIDVVALGAYCPLGYDYDGEVFTVNMHAETVRYIFEQFNAGKAMNWIAKQLNDGGNPTARGGQWYAGTVRYILTNGFYAGLIQWDGTETKGSHPAIIDLETYHTAIQRLKALKPGPMAKAA